MARKRNGGKGDKAGPQKQEQDNSEKAPSCYYDDAYGYEDFVEDEDEREPSGDEPQ